MRGRKGEPRFKHGLSKTPEYRAWQNMRDRCINPQHGAYRNYGARGITVCPQWVDSFDAFLADMGRRPGPEYSLDRIDNDGPYTPENCRWVVWQEQLKNRRKTIWITAAGQTKTLVEWSRETGLSRALIQWRLRNGWSDAESVLTKPGALRISEADGTEPEWAKERA